ncbi:MAG: DUF4340 domain-containing protein [Kofleriaceae bacterium]
MKSALIHGVLLAVMLVYGYRTWTRDKTVKPDYGSIVLWNKTEADLVAIEFKTEKKTIRLEHKDNAYWWGTETTIEKKPKPVDPAKKPDPAGTGSGSGSGSAPPAGSGSGSGSAAPKPAAGSGSGSAVAAGSGSGSAAGSGSGSGSAAPKPPPPPPVEMVETTKKREFPLGDGGDKIVKGYLEARALRELGSPTDAQKKDYKLDTAKSTLTITFKDGARAFLVGGSVYGGSDRYVQDQQSGAVYVLSKDIVAGLEIGESSLQLTDPRGFDITKIENVEIDWAGRKKAATRIQTDSENQKQVKTWGEADTKKPNQPLATFIDNINNMKPTEYKPDVKVDGVTPVFKVTYRDGKNATLGTLALYKIEKAGVLPEGQELDPANPPKGETEYYVMTEKTRVPALVRKDPAQRSEQDLPIVFGDKAPPVDVPKGNPFQGVKPDIKPHGGGMPPLPPPAAH